MLADGKDVAVGILDAEVLVLGEGILFGGEDAAVAERDGKKKRRPAPLGPAKASGTQVTQMTVVGVAVLCRSPSRLRTS